MSCTPTTRWFGGEGVVCCPRIVANLQTKAVDKKHWGALHSKKCCPGAEPMHPGNDKVVWKQVTELACHLQSTPNPGLYSSTLVYMKRGSGNVGRWHQTCQPYSIRDEGRFPFLPMGRHMWSQRQLATSGLQVFVRGLWRWPNASRGTGDCRRPGKEELEEPTSPCPWRTQKKSTAFPVVPPAGA